MENDSLDQLVEKSVASADKSLWKGKITEWIKRYGIAEIASTAAAYACSYSVQIFSENDISIAYGATIGATAGFYAAMCIREIKKDYIDCMKISEAYGAKGILKTCKNLVLEFGISELLDIILLRPVITTININLFGEHVGIFTGKIMADITFYTPAIICYELQKKQKISRI